MKITVTVGETSRSMDLADMAKALQEKTHGGFGAREVAGVEMADLFTKALDGEWTRIKQQVAEAYAILTEIT